MSRHKLIALASLVLGAAMLSPASALAEPQCPVPARVGAQGTCRPLLTGGTATVRLNTQTLQFTAEGTGVGTLAGSGRTVFYNGQATPIGFTPPNVVRLALEADVTITGANGDELYGHSSGTTDDFVIGSAHEDRGQVTITDGSGRFEGAHGVLDSDIHVSPGTFSQDNGVTWMTSRSEATFAGYVIY